VFKASFIKWCFDFSKDDAFIHVNNTSNTEL